MTSEQQPAKLSPDRPLADPRDDRLGYAPFAKQLARSILRGCPADGLVVALYGAWGTGKSTALNFILHYVDQDPDAEPAVVIRFNPWWFAGQEDLVRRFFKQFEATLYKAKARRRTLTKKIAAFGSLISDLPIPYAGTAAKAAAAIAASQAADVIELKEELVAELARYPRRIVVVIDDVDRLRAYEIRQLFQLVKAVADFPNVIYLMAFDRNVVVKALTQSTAIDGDEYLEKIVQVPFVLPPPDRVQLQGLMLEQLNRLLDGTPEELFDQQHWGNVYLDGIDPLITKPRDIARLTNALTVTYGAVRGEVNAVDFIAIEALRIFAPVAYETIRASAERFAGPGGQFDASQREAERRFHEAWLGQVGNDRAVVERLVRRLFPRLESVWGNVTHGESWVTEWRRRLRVCSQEAFPVYFRLAVPEGEVSAALVREVIANATDATATAERLLTLSRERRADGHTRATSLIARLNDHAEKDLPEAAVVPTLSALFDTGDALVEAGRRTNLFVSVGDDLQVGWVVKKLLRRLPREARAETLTPIFRSGRGLSTMVHELVYFEGQHGKWNREGVAEGERLIRAEDLTGLEQILLSRIRAAATDGSLWATARLTSLLDAWSMWGDKQEMRLAVATHVVDDEALLRFVGLLVTHLRSHGLTDRVARTSIQLDPERLADFVDVDKIAPQIEKLQRRQGLSDGDRTVIDAFIRGRRARAAGRDPKWIDDRDEDE